MDSFHYLVINLITVAYPLARCYEPRLRFMAEWKAILSAIAVVAAVFLSVDELMTQLGVWGFNTRYLSGIFVGELPLEEYLFFVTVPFSGLFIYEAVSRLLRTDFMVRWALPIALFFALSAGILAWQLAPRIYSVYVFGTVAIVATTQLLFARSLWLGRFFVSYAIMLVPFFVMNGWLTGAFTPEPIVWYDDFQFSGIRMGTIPFEDAYYLLSFYWPLVWLYERMRRAGASKAYI